MSMYTRGEILSTIMYPGSIQQETVRKILGYWQSDIWKEYSMELMDAIADLRELARILGVEKED